MAEDDLHHSGSAGEVTNALKAIINDIGTLKLIPSAKESARWFLDEKRYKSEKRRLNVDRWMTLVFGLVGTSGISEFLLRPYVKSFLVDMDFWVPIVSFSIASTLVLLLVFMIWIFNGR